MAVKTMRSDISRAAMELETALRDLVRPLQAAANTVRRLAFDSQSVEELNPELDRELGAQIRVIAGELRRGAQRSEWTQLDAKMQETERSVRQRLRGDLKNGRSKEN